MNLLNSIKEKIIKNEYKYAKYYPNRLRSVQLFIAKINKISYPYDLINFIYKSFISKQKKERLDEYTSKNLKTPLQIINKYLSDLESLPRFTVSELEIGKKYDPIMISALANNFNTEVGMYYVISNIKPFIILNAQISTNSNVQQYHNNWIIPYKKMKYILQQPRNVNDFRELKHNKEIINSFNNDLDLDILVFYRSRRNIDYTFGGNFQVVNINEDGSIELEIKELNKIDEYIKKDKSLFEIAFYPNKKLKEEKDINADLTKSRKVKKRDYLKTYINNLITGEEGEKLVVKFEEDRLSEIGIDINKYKVEKISDNDDTVGYDIKSYNIINDKIEEIFIEVKTTTESSFGRFYLSSNEYKAMRQKKDHYRIYRVFDINSNDPKLFIISNENFDEFNIEASTYIVNQG